MERERQIEADGSLPRVKQSIRNQPSQRYGNKNKYTTITVEQLDNSGDIVALPSPPPRFSGFAHNSKGPDIFDNDHFAT